MGARGRNPGWGRTTEQIELALHEVAIQGGNVEGACRVLNATATPPFQPATVRKWVRRGFANRYAEIQSEYRGDIGERMASHAMELARKAGEGAVTFVDRAVASIEDV